MHSSIHESGGSTGSRASRTSRTSRSSNRSGRDDFPYDFSLGGSSSAHSSWVGGNLDLFSRGDGKETSGINGGRRNNGGVSTYVSGSEFEYNLDDEEDYDIEEDNGNGKEFKYNEEQNIQKSPVRFKNLKKIENVVNCVSLY